MAHVLKQFIGGVVAVALIRGSDAQSCAAGSFPYTTNGVTLTVSHAQAMDGETIGLLDCSGVTFSGSPMQAGEGDSPGYMVKCTAGTASLTSMNCGMGSDSGSGSGSGTEVDCTSCAEGFDKNGGCKASETPNANVDSMVPPGCQSCGGAALVYCTSMGYNIPNQPTDTSMQKCGDVKREYKMQGCCGNPTKTFDMGSGSGDANRRLAGEDLLLEELKHVLHRTKMQRGPAAAQNLAKSIKGLLAEHTDARP